MSTDAPPMAYRPARALGVALVLVLGQVSLTCLFSLRTDPRSAYRTLFCWDGGWYADIVEHGYRGPGETDSLGNVAFFPAYPLLARMVSGTFGVSRQVALLLTAQAACVGFWAYFLLLGRLWSVPPRALAVGVALVAVHPAAFFLVASYSEALFLFGLLGFVFWTESDLPGGVTLAAAHGFLMTATRLVGAPLAIYPLLRVWLGPGGGFGARLRRSDVPLLIGVVAALGALSFFAFSAVRFGRWDVYFETERRGWDVKPDYWAVFYPTAYLPWLVRTVAHQPSNIEPLSQMTVPAMLALLLAVAAWEWRLARHGDSGWRTRLPLWLSAWLLFYVPLAGHYTRFFGSFLRFSLCPYVLLVLLGLRLAGQRKWPLRVRTALALWMLALLVLQAVLMYHFTHRNWVA